MLPYQAIEDLPKEKLLQLVSIYSKNWLATDGLWFQGVERHYGFDTALQIDREMWEQFTVIEANRIKALLELPDNAGLEGLRQALAFRFYASLGESETTIEGNTLTYKVVKCRVQYARKRKGMAYHTCKSVGLVEYALFASTIDDRITTECISCHPEVTDPSCDCMWKFTLEK